MNEEKPDFLIELERKERITCHGKYKYLSDLKQKECDYYNPEYDLYDAYKKEKDNSGIRLYVHEDKEKDYYIYPGINVIAGQTGHGKSIVANSIAYKAVKDGKNVLFFSLEISKNRIFYQMISIHSTFTCKTEQDFISHTDIKRHKLTSEQERKAFIDIWEDFQRLDGNLYVIDEFDYDSSNVDSMQEKMCLVEEYAQKHTGKGIDLIIIDYIQLLKSRSEISFRSEYESISQWVNDLRRISNNFLGQNREVTILLLSQLNRDAMIDSTDIAKKKAKNDILPVGKRKEIPNVVIGISQIAGTVEISKAACTIYAIYSDESYKSNNQCLFFDLKQRDGYSVDDPVVAYMQPKYYIFGHSNESNDNYVCDMSLDELIGNDNVFNTL